MAIPPGSRVGPYEILSALGAGGMGEVYRARDTKLGRDVAIKVLPAAFAHDPDRMARFQREAKVLAALSHANIATIYGLEESDGARALVMELLEGPTLAERLQAGPIALEEAVGIARQIAEALEAAHERGIVHRDLKPANIKLTQDDTVKVLDFGLAKAMEGETASADLANSPTLSQVATQAGVLLGTAAYMAPEQAKGKAVDKRADIWAFGCVMYEMLTGQMAFRGETVTDTLAAVMKEEPDWNLLPASTPQNIRFVLHRCLEKERGRRLRDAADLRILIEEVQDLGKPEVRPRHSWHWVSWSLAAIFVLTTLVLASIHFREKAPYEPPMRFQIPLPDKVNSISGPITVSPDGRLLAFAGMGSDGVQRLWVRALDTLEAHPLFGTESSGLLLFFWSPDSRFIAFSAQDKLKKIAVFGGPPQTICDVSGRVLGGSWNRDGVILFGNWLGSNVIMRVSAAGGVPSPVTRLNPKLQEVVHLFPVFLPDGRRFLYYVRAAKPENAGICVGSLESNPEKEGSRPIISTSSTFAYVPSQDSHLGQLLLLRERTLVAQQFDEKRLELVGEPVLVAEPVGSIVARLALISSSTNGVLVYKPPLESRFAWFDRGGRVLGMVGDPGDYLTFDLSKDTNHLVVSKSQQEGQQNLWLMDLLRGSTTRLTIEEALHSDPRWSPDGRKIIFGSTRDPSRSPFQLSLPGSAPEQIFKFDGKAFALDDWSPDGRHLLYHDASCPELWALPLAGGRKPFLVTRSIAGFVDQARFSPDGHWVAYNTNESGRFEVKIVPFPPTGDKWQISTAGGGQPTWRRDGRELYFLTPDGTLTAVDVRRDKTFAWGEARPLFKTQLNVSYEMEQYLPAPDGKRFLLLGPAAEDLRAPFTVLVNWTALLKK